MITMEKTIRYRTKSKVFSGRKNISDMSEKERQESFKQMETAIKNKKWTRLADFAQRFERKHPRAVKV